MAAEHRTTQTAADPRAATRTSAAADLALAETGYAALVRQAQALAQALKAERKRLVARRAAVAKQLRPGDGLTDLLADTLTPTAQLDDALEHLTGEDGLTRYLESAVRAELQQAEALRRYAEGPGAQDREAWLDELAGEAETTLEEQAERDARRWCRAQRRG